jgi:5-methylcytosine-specific restriction endonuclease McrA
VIEADSDRVLSSSVLVLNRYYLPVHVITVRRAFILLYRECAEIVHIEDGQFTNYDFESWCEISAFRASDKQPHEDWVQSVKFEVQCPRVLRLLKYDRSPRSSLRFNRRNLFARDGHRCQYCGRSFPSQQLSLDHVMPRSRGGETSWQNVVCSCVGCNTKKGNRTPHEAHMRLMTLPTEPTANPILLQKLRNPKYASWQTFLPHLVVPHRPGISPAAMDAN